MIAGSGLIASLISADKVVVKDPRLTWFVNMEPTAGRTPCPPSS